MIFGGRRPRGATRRAALCHAIVVCGIGASAAPAFAQRLPFAQGSRVRVRGARLILYIVEFGQAYDTTRWFAGTVVDGTRESLSLMPDTGRGLTLAMFSESTRLQIHRGRRSPTVPGTILGLTVGAGLGVTVLSSVFGDENLSDAQGRIFGAVVFGAAGALAGGLVASRIGEDRWEEVPLADGRIPVAPHPVADARPQTVGSTWRWSRFRPTDEDFVGFFVGHIHELEPLEGLWETDTPGGRRVAIVRDPRVEGFDYIVVRVARGRVRPDDGEIIAALRASDRADEYELEFSPTYFPTAQVPRFRSARLREGELELRGAGLVKWVRVMP